MTGSGSWVEAVVAAGAVPASHVPEASLGRGDVEEFTGADPVEAAELRVYPLGDAPPLTPGTVGFLDGIEQWRVVAYGGITPIVRAHAAAAIRRRGPDRRLRTVAEATDEVAITRLDQLPARVRRVLEAAGVRVLEIPADDAGPPARTLAAARVEVQKVRAALERRLAERRLRALAADEWLVVDGVLSDSAALSEHPRALGVVKSHGAQYFEGAELERALTLPDGHRTGCFGRARAGPGATSTPGTCGSGRGRETTCCTVCCASKRAPIRTRWRSPRPSRRGCGRSARPSPPPTGAGIDYFILSTTWRRT